MQRHAEEAIQVLLKRKADQETADKRKLEKAEAVCRKYLTSETYHAEAAEKLADAVTLLGWNGGELLFEATLTSNLQKWMRDLDTLEYRYREAVAEQARQEAYWKNQRVAEGDSREYAMKAVLRMAAQNVEAWAHHHEVKQRTFAEMLRKTRYPRAVPPRYRLALNKVLELYPPAELPEDERNKPLPGRAAELPIYPPDPELDAINAALEADRSRFSAVAESAADAS